MIACPNCSHENPDGATQCEACYTPLPTLTTCPNCGATVQANASFCGQCGFNLEQTNFPNAVEEPIFMGVNDPDPLPDPTPESTLYSPVAAVEGPALAVSSAQGSAGVMATQLQTQAAQLLHVQTQTVIPLSSTVGIVHIGKPGGAVAPDIDVSGFPDSAIVSRVHADIRLESEGYFVEDRGSSNGTYVNHNPLLPGNRHRLRSGDRIALGKEDKVTFVFQQDAP